MKLRLSSRPATAVGTTPQFFFGATDVAGTIAVDGDGLIAPGDQAEVGFDLMKPVGLEKGVRSPSAKAAKPSAPVW